MFVCLFLPLRERRNARNQLSRGPHRSNGRRNGRDEGSTHKALSSPFPLYTTHPSFHSNDPDALQYSDLTVAIIYLKYYRPRKRSAVVSKEQTFFSPSSFLFSKPTAPIRYLPTSNGLRTDEKGDLAIQLQDKFKTPSQQPQSPHSLTYLLRAVNFDRCGCVRN